MSQDGPVYHSDGFRFNEKYLSQIPAIQLLINLGYVYLTPQEALKERLDKTDQILLEGILRVQLKKINRIQYKGQEFLFTEENIQSAIQKLKNIPYDGLLKTNEAVYDLITLGTALEQNIEGDSKSFNLKYIDWQNPERNMFHVTSEFSVERSRSTETVRPDIVLFVNGIPFVIIECKSPKIEIDQAISQSIRNQGFEYIPKLFMYAQMVLGLNKNEARFATVGSDKEFWAIWKEKKDKKEKIIKIVNQFLTVDQKDHLFSGEFDIARSHFNALEKEERLVTEQDKALFSLCRPERLLELNYKFTVFEGIDRKIARYQQYFVIKSTLERIKQKNAKGIRKGGIIWHTQGSGKSLTMVMLARNLALDSEIPNPRLILVTDRKNLDEQLSNTFATCGLDRSHATSGRDLLKLISKDKATIVTTLIQKFEKALNIQRFQDDSPNIFMLIDESHRSQFGSMAARMRQMFPKACYIGFTGTPLMKSEKNNFIKFGGLIEPYYSITQAVDDKSVVPLLYEGRMVEMEQNKAAIDLWFERHTSNMTDKQKADLKRKYARAEMLNKADRVVYMRAFDISEHYRSTWQGTGFKAQLVAPNKSTAIKYHMYLNEIGLVSSEVVISGPDAREGYDEVDEEPTDDVIRFWKKMMRRFGNEENYNKQIINQFKAGDTPEIIIVVSKLLTGFDAPKNTVIYLCKELREHSLLQAIARVNRIHENKEFGYVVDYVGLLGKLDEALTMYSALENFDEADLAGALLAIDKEIEKLPQKHSDLWDLFKTIKNSRDEEAYEVFLREGKARDEFYERLSEFSRTLTIALSSHDFIINIENNKLRQYKTDLKRFQNLKSSVRLRYAESISYKDYEPKIKKLLDTHIQANEVIQLNEPVNIFDDDAFMGIKDQQGVYERSTASQADSIAHALKKTITEKMEEDPAFYEKFSKLIQKAIDDFRNKRISDLEYLKRTREIRDKFVSHQHDDVPDALDGNEDAMAYFGILKPYFEKQSGKSDQWETIATNTAVAIQEILKKHWKVHFWDDHDAQKQAINDIDDYLFDEVKNVHGFQFSLTAMDEIIERTMRVARHRSS
ncbi:type I restriction endonuclease subunit R [bacterium]|nr:type I restriction endonuclease subunit R [bacterium]